MTNWLDTRHQLGEQANRAAALALVCAGSGYQPLPWQLLAHRASTVERDETMQKLVIGGLGCGGTEWLVHESAILALLNPGGFGIIAAPSYHQIQTVLVPRWKGVMARMARAGYPLEQHWHGTLQRSGLYCGGGVYFRSLSKVEAELGVEYSWASLTEIETMPRPDAVWNTLLGRVRQTAYVRQIGGESTPRGLQGCVAKFHAAREAAKAAPEPERTRRLRKVWQCRVTSLDNPHLPADYLDSLRPSYSKRLWAQDVLAQILQPETSVFPELEAERHVRPWVYDPTMDYVMGYDAGHQWATVLWIQRTKWDEWIVFDELVEDGIPAGHLHAEVEARCSRLGKPPTHIGCDKAVADELAWARRTFQHTRVSGLYPREVPVGEGIQRIRTLLDPLDGRPKLFVSDRVHAAKRRRGTFKSLLNYRYRQRGDGTLSADPWKDNTHDHTVDALRYGLVVAMRDSRLRSVARKM